MRDIKDGLLRMNGWLHCYLEILNEWMNECGWNEWMAEILNNWLSRNGVKAFWLANWVSESIRRVTSD